MPIAHAHDDSMPILIVIFLIQLNQKLNDFLYIFIIMSCWLWCPEEHNSKHHMLADECGWRNGYVWKYNLSQVQCLNQIEWPVTVSSPSHLPNRSRWSKVAMNGCCPLHPALSTHNTMTEDRTRWRQVQRLNHRDVYGQGWEMYISFWKWYCVAKDHRLRWMEHGKMDDEFNANRSIDDGCWLG